MGIQKENLIEPFAVQEVFCDGFTDHFVFNGNMSCTGYRIHRRDRMLVASIRLIFPVSALDAAIRDARAAQTAPPMQDSGKRIGRH